MNVIQSVAGVWFGSGICAACMSILQALIFFKKDLKIRVENIWCSNLQFWAIKQNYNTMRGWLHFIVLYFSTSEEIVERTTGSMEVLRPSKSTWRGDLKNYIGHVINKLGFHVNITWFLDDRDSIAATSKPELNTPDFALLNISQLAQIFALELRNNTPLLTNVRCVVSHLSVSDDFRKRH